MGVASIERGERSHPHQRRVQIFKRAFTLHELHKSRPTHCKLWNTDSDSSFVTLIIHYSTLQHTVTRKQRSKLIDAADKVTAAGVVSGRLKWTINDVHSVRRLCQSVSQSVTVDTVCQFSVALWTHWTCDRDSRMSSGPPLKRL